MASILLHSTLAGMSNLFQELHMISLLTPTNFLVFTSAVSRETVLVATLSSTEATSWYWLCISSKCVAFFFLGTAEPQKSFFVVGWSVPPAAPLPS